MTKTELYEAMGGRISMKAIGEYSDEYVIMGKYGMVSWMDGYWDVWITGVHLNKVLTPNRVKRLCESIKPLAKTLDTDLYREAIGVAKGSEEAYQIAILAGARKKRSSSPSQLANLKNAA